MFDIFPWPQSPALAQAQAVAAAAPDLRTLRRKVMADNGWSLRDLYRTLELPGRNPLRDAHQRLDAAVRAAYGMGAKDDPLAFLLALNKAVAEREAQGQPVPRGLPPCVTDPAPFVTTDCVTPPWWRKLGAGGPGVRGVSLGCHGGVARVSRGCHGGVRGCHGGVTGRHRGVIWCPRGA